MSSAIRGSLWGIFLLLLVVPPVARPASSDAFPWSTVTTEAEPQDPVGANVQVTVPIATPSATPIYETVRNGIVPTGTVSGAGRLPSRSTPPIGNNTQPSRPLSISNNVVAMLGEITGTVKYEDGEVVIFGTDGILHLRANQAGSLTLSNGHVISFHDRASMIRRLADRQNLM